MVLVVASDEAEVTIQRMLSGPIQDFTITGIAFMDDSFKGDIFNGIPVIGNIDTVQDYLCREWVDEVFVKVTDTEPYPRKLIDEIVTMGLTVHLSLGSVEQSLSGKKFVEKIGDYTVVTSSINTISIDGYNSLARIGSCCGHCLHPVLLQIQEDRAKIFQPPHLPGIVEFLSSDADRRCFMYFHPYARVL